MPFYRTTVKMILPDRDVEVGEVLDLDERIAATIGKDRLVSVPAPKKAAAKPAKDEPEAE